MVLNDQNEFVKHELNVLFDERYAYIGGRRRGRMIGTNCLCKYKTQIFKNTLLDKIKATTMKLLRSIYFFYSNFELYIEYFE